MKKSGTTGKHRQIDISIHMPEGPVPLNNETGALLLPADASSPGPRITYGPYLRAIANYLSGNSCRPLRTLLARLPSPRHLSEVTSISLTSEKHGAVYSVSRLDIRCGSKTFPFAVNAAFLPAQQAFLQHEHALLGTLYRRYRLPHLPRPFLSGTTLLQTGETSCTIKLLFVEWFHDYHEFHLSGPHPVEGDETGYPIRVWKPGDASFFLDPDQVRDLYRKAAAILTAYLDGDTFRQVYPWHHAAGDFVVRTNAGGLDVRLITVRSYRSLLPGRSDAKDKLLGLLHFLINLSLRMRLDRLDGTGALVWAGPGCLRDVVLGFSEAWENRRRDDSTLPRAADALGLFLQFSRDERLAFTEIVARNGQVERDEGDFLHPRLEQHTTELAAVMESRGKNS